MCLVSYVWYLGPECSTDKMIIFPDRFIRELVRRKVHPKWIEKMHSSDQLVYTQLLRRWEVYKV